jgi:hypothetical protein
MSFSIQTMATGTFVTMLRTLSALLDRGSEHASAKGIDVQTLLAARLAPDMFPLAQQATIACDLVRDAMTRLTGGAAPAPTPDGETLAGLQARIAQTIAFVESVPASAFDGAEESAVSLEFPANNVAFDFTGAEFLRDWSLPNVYFHVVTAYDILRREGVALGKRDFLLGAMRYFRAPK